MAAGPTIMGAAMYLGIKAAGYSCVGWRMKRVLPRTRVPAVAFGAGRTLLGVVVGCAVMAAFAEATGDGASALFLLALIPVRFTEWFLALTLFYARAGLTPEMRFRYVMGGIALSFALDVPAILAVIVVPGGMWVC